MYQIGLAVSVALLQQLRFKVKDAGRASVVASRLGTGVKDPIIGVGMSRGVLSGDLRTLGHHC